MSAPPPMVWIDMEMSGLDPDACAVLEIATVVTNEALEVIAEGPDIVVHQPDAVLDAMDAWCTEHHGASGLTKAVRNSTVSLAEAERQTVDFLGQYTQPGVSPLCGNSVWQDRRFIIKYLPALDRFLHYRLVDVSSIKELSRRWYPDTKPPLKRETHRALDDILESIAELKFYRESIFR